MQGRFQQGPSTQTSSGIENGGMFTRQRIQQLTQKIMSTYDHNYDDVLQPQNMAKVMIDTYRGMNKHFIPTGADLSTYAKVFDKSRKGKITRQDIQATAMRMFLANKK